MQLRQQGGHHYNPRWYDSELGMHTNYIQTRCANATEHVKRYILADCHSLASIMLNQQPACPVFHAGTIQEAPDRPQTTSARLLSSAQLPQDDAKTATAADYQQEKASVHVGASATQSQVNQDKITHIYARPARCIDLKPGVEPTCRCQP